MAMFTVQEKSSAISSSLSPWLRRYRMIFSLRFIKVASVFFNAASPPEYMMIIAPFERKKVNRALTCGKTFEKIQKFFRRGGKYDLKNGERETYDFFGTIY